MSETRRDVSWTVMFRLERTGVWAEWSKGHRSPGEAVANAEALAKLPAVADIRFECVTVQRDLYSLHELAEQADAAGGES